MTKRRFISSARLFHVLALAVSSNVFAQVKVAYIDPLSGPFAAIGDFGLKSFIAAADDVNAKGGLPGGQKLEIVPMDNKGSPEESLLLFKKVTDRGIRYIIQGQGSGAAGALIGAVNKWNERNPDKSVLFLNYSSNDPELTNAKCSFWYYSFDAHNLMKMEALTNYIAKDKSIKKVFILGQDYAHGQQLAKAVTTMLPKKRPDIEIVGNDLHPFGKVKDFSPYVAKIKDSGADTVITGNWGNDLSLLLRAAKEASLKTKFFTYFAAVRGTPTALGEMPEGTVYQISEWHRNISPNTLEKFADDYAKRFPGLEFSYVRINTTVQMLAEAMNKSKSLDPKQVSFALEGMEYQAGNGKVTMRKADHQLLQPMVLSVYSRKDGKEVRHDTEGTGYGFKTVAMIPASETEVPTTCAMKRPDGKQ
ncbi:branched-chain amino acid ABC transporter substrate-binding protein [Noviherbaspirillum pedocola]|uniref:Branched-chain amino acid ABC transporter substrate-binding protein n=1 Tax=Noviherbaspirillum pedocola TaxID=2801341 RepID=A0A934W4N6_9BURK|nr:branched-chain amino acid ABC transporter substrate-binding protein [Noviherbaspirillum pedocola]MBK4738731.1 branched-chain amino acid ABC transporter substrate-binding protein [Noviherbaspirillum pedocola]